MQDTNPKPQTLGELIEQICSNTPDIKQFLSSRGLKADSVEAILVPNNANFYKVLDESDVLKLTTKVSPDKSSYGYSMGIIKSNFALWRDFIVYTKDLILFRYEDEDKEYSIVLPRKSIPARVDVNFTKWRSLIQLKPKY